MKLKQAGVFMANYKELLNQREALEKQIEAARRAELGEAIASVKNIIQEFGLTEADIFTGGKQAARKSSGPVAPKYRDPATGQTWTGRGKPPKWIAEKDRQQFAIAQ